MREAEAALTCQPQHQGKGPGTLIGSILLPFSGHVKARDNYHIQSVTSFCRIALTLWCQGGKDVKTKNSELSLERASQRRPKYLTEKRTAVKL